MTVYLIRHGRTDANGQYYAGRADIPLNETGRAEARALVRVLSGHPIDRILTSPLCRARGTAAPLSRDRGLRARIEPALAELDFGALEGQPKTPLVLRKAHLHVPVEGGESLADLWRRLGPVADTILASQNRRQHVAVVAHFWSLRLLAGLLRRQGLEAAAAARDIRLRNGAVVMLCEGAAPAELQAARAVQVLAIR